MSHVDPLVEPRIHPFFYPNGKSRWPDKIMKVVRGQSREEKVSRNQYVKYKIGIRPDVFNAFL